MHGNNGKKRPDLSARNKTVLMREISRKNGLKNKDRKVSTKTKLRMALAQTGRKHTIETRKKIGKARSGPKCNFWKNGKTEETQLIRCSLEYKLWRTRVFKRDNYQCVLGGNAHGTKLEADHIKPFALYPELRFDVNNGRTLCEDCHRATDTYGVNAIRLYDSQRVPQL